VVEGLEAERGRRVQPERPLTGGRVPLACPSRCKLAQGTAAGVLVSALAAGCAGSPNAASKASAPTTSPTATTAAPASMDPYSWQRDQGQPISLGGGSTSTLSAVVSPSPVRGSVWLIAGTELSATGAAGATVWTSANAIDWSKTDLPAPSGQTSAADAATNWGDRNVVVGSAGSGPSMRAAVWVSQGRGQHFVPVPDSAAFDAPPATPTGEAGGAVMETVTAGALGLFAAGTVNGQAAVWYSTDGQRWQLLSGAGSAINQDPGAAVNDIVSTSAGVFAGGSFQEGDRLMAALWYSSDGIHWAQVHSPADAPSGVGDHIVTSLVGIGATGTSVPGAPTPSGLLAAGAARIGSTWQPASWISPNGFSWSQTSESFPLDAEPPNSPGAIAYEAAGAAGHLFAVGGSPARQRLWQSADGLAWTEVPLPAPPSDDQSWHLGLVAATSQIAVLADNLPGQPYVLVRRNSAWYEPSANGAFSYPQPTAMPTSLVDDDGTLVMSVELSSPGRRLGAGSSSVAVLTSSNGRSWRTVTKDAFADSTVNQLLPVPTGLLAVGSAPLPAPVGGRATNWTGAFASLSPNGGATWPTEPISPASLGGDGPAGSSGAGAGSVGTGGATAIGGSTRPGGTSNAGAGAAGAANAAMGTARNAVVPTSAAPIFGPLAATAAGRLGNSDYVVGEAGPQAVGWYSPDGTSWEAPQPLDTSPQLGTERPLATCWTGNSAVVVGSVTSTGPGSLPAAWVSSDGSSWTNAAFSPSPVAGSTNTVDGCLATGNGFIAYGATTGDGLVEQPALWSSNDGTLWKQLSASFTGLGGGAPVEPEAAPLDGIAIGTTTWLGLSGDGQLPSQRWPAPVGGAAGAQFTAAGLWSSDDAGNTWQQLDTEVPAFSGAMYAQADVAAYVGQDPVVAGTVDGRLAIWVGTPASGANHG
jgi:hypothetical protein